MKIERTLTDEAILTEVGERITRCRLERQLTQATLARQAGIAKRTLERVEAGETAQTNTIIRIFRVLDLLPNLDQMLPGSNPGPLEVMRRKGKVRKRASAQQHRSATNKPWTWGDD